VTNGAIVAYTVVEESGTPALRPSWASRDMISPVPVTIVNGVVFALASGEYRGADAQTSATRRAQLSKPAILYALDAATGKELWTSGAAITSFVHAVGPSAGDGQVYVVTYDGTVYAFGIPVEH
jgi:outer membrane protein assembly factor BamB